MSPREAITDGNSRSFFEKLRVAFGKQGEGVMKVEKVKEIPQPGTKEYVDYFFEQSEYVQPRPPIPPGGSDLRGGHAGNTQKPPAQGS